jgi:hypothetical protein
VGEPDEDDGSIYQRLTDWETAAPYWDAINRDRWRYSLGPYPIEEDASWPQEWTFTVTVEFPPFDIPEVTRRVQKLASIVGS